MPEINFHLIRGSSQRLLNYKSDALPIELTGRTKELIINDYIVINERNPLLGLAVCFKIIKECWAHGCRRQVW